MRLITLNIWGGKEFNVLMEFIERVAADTDIFCFQEVLFGSESTFTKINKGRVNVFEEIILKLIDFTGYKYLAKQGSCFGGEPLPPDTEIGQAIFIRSSLKVISSGGLRTYTENSYIAGDPKLTVCGNFQYIDITEGNSKFVIGNLHGLWQENTNKMDTPERIMQSEIVRNFLNSKSGRKVLTGDFNLRPDTKSMKVLEEGMCNLVMEHSITSTRSSLYPKEVKFSDYILTSQDVRVNNFNVLDDVVSDHLPLSLIFS